MRKGFRFSHSVIGLAALLVLQWVVVSLWPLGVSAWLVLVAGLAGALSVLYVATEVIERVRQTERMLGFLFAVVAEFVLFFAFEYWFLTIVSPASFPALSADASVFLLQSLMVFVFNPLYLPATDVGRLLLIVNTGSALGLVLFVLQNIWQIRRPA